MLINKGYLNLIVTEFESQTHNLRSNLKILPILSNSLQTFFLFPLNFTIALLVPCVNHHLEVLLKICWRRIVENLEESPLLKQAYLTWQLEISRRLDIVELSTCLHSSSATSISICFHHWSIETSKSSFCIFIQVKFDCSDSYNFDVHLIDLMLLSMLHFRSWVFIRYWWSYLDLNF